METFNNEMVQITSNGETFEVDKMLYHFIEFLKLHGDDISNISNIVNEFQSFLEYWDDFKKSKRNPTYESKNLNRFNLFHTIKPNTEYANQQDYKEGKPMLYPVYRIERNTVYSQASGGNYPLVDCIIYVGDGSSIVPIK
jgi:hypothetical protein